MPFVLAQIEAAATQFQSETVYWLQCIVFVPIKPALYFVDDWYE